MREHEPGGAAAAARPAAPPAGPARARPGAAAEPVPRAAGAYPWFIGGTCSWFGAWGMQSVLFSWIVVADLRASAEWVGVAQTSTMLPALLLLLIGGAAADRVDPRRLLIGLHALAALPVLALAAGVISARLSIRGLILYGVMMGTVSAFAFPARDTLLSRVAGASMMRAVTGMTAAQFGSQAAGALVAGAARWIGSAPALGIQAGVLLLGSWLAVRLPAARPPRGQPARSALHEIAGGLAVVARSPALRAPIVLVISVGFLFVGPFLVVFPLLVRDFYQGSVGDLSLVMMQFPLGTIAGSLVLLARGGIRRKGLSALLALAVGALALGAIGLGPPFPGMVAATFVWGLFGSVFINSSRTLYQEAAPALQRARVLAVYQLGFLGAGPLGALCAGFLAARIGPLETLLAFAAGMLALVALVGALTDTARMQ